MIHLLQEIYPKATACATEKKIQKILQKYKDNPIIQEKKEARKNLPPFSEKDAVLITYADTITEPNTPSLHTLRKFLKTYIQNKFSTIHILPFYPSSSDGGFSVKDFRKIDSQHGDWKDIQNLAKDYRIMSDLVLNHVSSESEWFQKFLAGEKKYQDYFVHFPKKVSTRKVFRPRVQPLLTEFLTHSGEKKYVWTTFSPDQVDLNYENPDVLCEIIDILLFYLSQGIECVRLDAVGFLWKDRKNSSIHLPKTHAIIQLLRSITEEIAPYAVLITETNVRYKHNTSYFGTQNNEAHAVYGFHLPPIVVHAFFKNTTKYLEKFYKKKYKNKGVMLNFLASHDGIGLLGAKNIMPDEEVNELVSEVLHHREGFVSYKTIADENHPYELNISFFDALSKSYEESREANQKFLSAHAISFFLQGVPAIYIHSLLGSRSNHEEAREKGIKRLINRAQIPLNLLEESLSEPSSRRAQILEGIHALLSLRKQLSCCAPQEIQKIKHKDSRIWCCERRNKDSHILLLVNTSAEEVEISEHIEQIDLLTKNPFSGKIQPYQTLVLSLL